ncbi:MAG: BamA/TamA family outer membrane protein [Gemmatimonadota bacterium]
MHRRTRRVSLVMLLAALFTGLRSQLVAAQAIPTPPDSVRWVQIAPNPEYDASTLWRFIFGGDYRDLWTTPTKIAVLDLQTFAGGLTPVKVGGGQQTKSLRLEAPDGRQFSFRSVDKDPSTILPADLKGTIADDILQDQISSAYPAGPLVVSRLLDAAGVLHSPPLLFVMPDDPALGEFRATFRNMLGTLEEHPVDGKNQIPGLAASPKIIGMDKLLERLEKRPAEHIDTIAYLKARLMDVFVGDWDRHRGQWSWARLGPDEVETAWSPLPEDRDQAFVKYDGLMLSIARKTRPQLVNFGVKYPSIYGATFNGRELDRQLLGAVDLPVWDSLALDLKRRLTNAVIDSAVATLPAQQRRVDGDRLAATLRARRDQLSTMAGKYFRYLNTEPDMHGTDLADRVTITRGLGPGRANGAIEVLIEGNDTVNGLPVVIRSAHRVFRAAETREVRLYLHGGDDSVLVSGEGSGEIKIRVIGGKGEDAVVDSSASGRIRFYDTGEYSSLVSAHGGSLHQKKYLPPDTSSVVPPRDWGAFKHPVLWGSAGADLGVFIGLGLNSADYGFRKDPYANQYLLRVGYATAPRTYRVDFRGTWHMENSRTYTSVLARASGIEILRFYGFGNETVNNGDDDFYKVRQEQYLLQPSITFPLSKSFTLSMGPRLQYNRLEENNEHFIGTLPGLYGQGNFGQVGASASVQLDTRDIIAAPRKGILLDLEGVVYPGVWDVQSTFGKVRADLSTYLSASIPSHPTLALRVGGEGVFGRFPFHEAAYIGGPETIRGWQAQRFAGDASMYGNAELRVRLGRIPLIVPTDLGLFGLADAGRVYKAGETSDEWHTAFGGGVSLGFLARTNTMTVAIARSDERTVLYIRAGFLY